MMEDKNRQLRLEMENRNRKLLQLKQGNNHVGKMNHRDIVKENHLVAMRNQHVQYDEIERTIMQKKE